MPLYKDIAIFAGTLTVAYLMLKIYRFSKKDKDENSSNSQESEEQVKKNVGEIESEGCESKSKNNKRKLEEIEGDMKLPKLKPNFFLGFKVYNKDLHKKVKTLQESIISKNPSLYPALINIPTLHITLAVTHLASEVDIKKVKEKLDDWGDKNSKLYAQEPIVLNFTGVGVFNDTVAYVGLEKCQNYQRLCDLSQSVNNLLSSAGYSTDSKGFTPHLTILKLTKNFQLLRSRKKFKKDFDILKQHKENFGYQEMSHVQLLSMNEPKDSNGYYKCFHEVNFIDIEETDHSECCSPISNPKKVG